MGTYGDHLNSELSKVKLSFGTHKGTTVLDTPDDYLQWFIDAHDIQTVEYLSDTYWHERDYKERLDSYYGSSRHNYDYVFVLATYKLYTKYSGVVSRRRRNQEEINDIISKLNNPYEKPDYSMPVF